MIDATAPTTLAVVTIEQLRAVVREAVNAALSEQQQDEELARPELVTGKVMAELLSVSRTTLHRWRVSGMPAIPVGDTYRYRPAAVLAWLESDAASQEPETTDAAAAVAKPEGSNQERAERESGSVSAVSTRKARALPADARREHGGAR